MVTAFQRNAFQDNAFQIDTDVGGGASGGTRRVLRLPPVWEAPQRKTRQPALLFDLGSVAIVLDFKADTGLLERIPRPEPVAPPIAPIRLPRTYTLPPVGIALRFSATAGMLELEPADDPDELFMLGLT